MTIPSLLAGSTRQGVLFAEGWLNNQQGRSKTKRKGTTERPKSPPSIYALPLLDRSGDRASGACGSTSKARTIPRGISLSGYSLPFPASLAFLRAYLPSSPPAHRRPPSPLSHAFLQLWMPHNGHSQQISPLNSAAFVVKFMSLGYRDPLVRVRLSGLTLISTYCSSISAIASGKLNGWPRSGHFDVPNR